MEIAFFAEERTHQAQEAEEERRGREWRVVEIKRARGRERCGKRRRMARKD